MKLNAQVRWVVRLFADLPGKEYTGKVVGFEGGKLLVRVAGRHWDGAEVILMDESELSFRLDSTPEPPPAWKPEDRRTSPRSLPGIAPDFKTPSIRGQKTFLVD